PDNRPRDAASHYALDCLSRLKVAEQLTFPPPDDPSKDWGIRKARIKWHCDHIFNGDYSLRYGRHVRRLYHRVVLMPKEGRCNLLFPLPSVEYDVRTCHPLLMLALFADPVERTKYAELLSGDIYSRIGEEMGICNRKRVKEDFQRVVNLSHKTP